MGPTLLKIARDALYAAVRGEDYSVDLVGLPSELSSAGMSFVTLIKLGQLRGCIGSLVATVPLAVDVATNARKAALSDPRFDPVELSELADLEIEVSVLSQPLEMEIGSYEELLRSLRPGLDGLVVRDREQKATFLPTVWEQLVDPERFVAALWQKAGLDPGAWSRHTRIATYATQVFGPVDV